MIGGYIIDMVKSNRNVPRFCPLENLRAVRLSILFMGRSFPLGHGAYSTNRSIIHKEEEEEEEEEEEIPALWFLKCSFKVHKLVTF